MMHSKRTARFFSHHEFTGRAVIVSNFRSLSISKQMKKTNTASIREVFFSFFFSSLFTWEFLTARRHFQSRASLGRVNEKREELRRNTRI